MKSIFGVAILALAMIACGQKQETTQTEAVADTKIEPGCYTYVSNQDSAFLQIDSADSLVSGKLSYQLFEKDSNKGTIAGRIQGDTLIATYTFQSEGRRSRRQVAFLRSGDNWVEGFGPVKDDAGQMVFEDISALNFASGIRFKPAECPGE